MLRTRLDQLRTARLSFTRPTVGNAPVPVHAPGVDAEDALHTMMSVAFTRDMEVRTAYAPNAMTATGKRTGENFKLAVTVSKSGPDLRLTMDASNRAGVSRTIPASTSTHDDVMAFITTALDNINEHYPY